MPNRLYGYLQITDKKPKYEGNTYSDLMAQAAMDRKKIDFVSDQPENPFAEDK